jgi:uncharacterized protein
MFRPGKDKGIATPVPLGLATLATTTFLLGIAMIFQAPATWTPYFTQALLFGGFVELLAGMWAFSYGDPLASTAFAFLGGFNMWWGLAHMNFLGITAAAGANWLGMGMVFAVSGFVVFYLWIASFYESAAFNLTLLFLWICYGLVAISLFTALEPLEALGGIAAIISALIAAYGSFAEIYNATGLHEVVPLGEPREVRQRAEQEEEERLRRLHMDHLHQGDAGMHA